MADQPTFHELKEQLEDILGQLQADNIDVDEALKLHEKGNKLLDQLEKRLDTAEHTVKTLKPKRG